MAWKNHLRSSLLERMKPQKKNKITICRKAANLTVMTMILIKAVKWKEVNKALSQVNQMAKRTALSIVSRGIMKETKLEAVKQMYCLKVKKLQ